MPIPVVFVRVDPHFERFAVRGQLGGHFVGVLNVHVVVGRAVRDQQFSFEPVGETDRRIVVVARRIVLRHAVINFGVNRVVETP